MHALAGAMHWLTRIEKGQMAMGQRGPAVGFMNLQLAVNVHGIKMLLPGPTAAVMGMLQFATVFDEDNLTPVAPFLLPG